MKIIDPETWKRRDHFIFYNRLEYPYLNITANVDVTRLIPWIKANGYSVFATIAYITSRAANEIPELRLRIRGELVVEHVVVRSSFTVLADDKTFGFATVDYAKDFSVFHQRVLDGIQATRANPSIKDEPGRDDMIFLTTMTWVSFTQINHPLPLNPPDSFPRITWGKIFNQQDQTLMPLSLNANHALVDGLHVGQFFEIVQKLMDEPQQFS
jgi:chloramphenicol O-acetyltransferase type A